MAKQQEKPNPIKQKIAEVLTPLLPESLARKIFLGLAAISLVVMVYLSKDYGITGDENYHRVYGHHVLDFYTSMGKDTTAITPYGDPDSLMRYYGGFYDGTASFLALKVFKNSDEWRVRHAWNATLGWGGMVAVGLIVAEIAGWQAALIAFLFMVLSPRFFGESMNNPKDIPMATGYMLSYLFIIRFLKNIDNPSWKNAIGLGLSIGMTMGIRIGGLLLIPYFLLFYGLYFVYNYGFATTLSVDGFKKYVVPTLKYAVVAVIISYFFSLLFWPFGLVKPFTNPFVTLEYMSKFPVTIRILFEGESISSTEVPWYYIPKWFLISTPLFGLIGLAASFFIWGHYKKSNRLLLIGFIYFTLVFPVAYVVYKKSALYDTMRHFFFVYPSIIILAALAFDYFINKFQKSAKYIIAGVLLVLLLLPGRFMFANHPNEYVYFNELVGGAEGAYGNYEMDYYMNSVHVCNEWIKKNEKLEKRADGSKLKIFSTAIAPVYFDFLQDSSKIETRYTRYYERIDKDADYFVFYSRFIDRQQLLNKTWPPEQAVFVSYVDGIPLSCVIKRNDRMDYEGFLALQKGDFATALQKFQAYVQKYPNNETALLYLGIAYAQTGQIDNAINAVQASLNIYQNNGYAVSLMNQLYAAKQPR
jgi:hypothetical protein